MCLVSVVTPPCGFDMEIVAKFCKLIISASKLGTSKFFLQSISNVINSVLPRSFTLLPKFFVTCSGGVLSCDIECYLSLWSQAYKSFNN